MKKKRQVNKSKDKEQVTLKDFLDESLVKQLKEQKEKLKAAEEEKKALEEQKKREERRQREKNKTFEELLQESDLDWRNYK